MKKFLRTTFKSDEDEICYYSGEGEIEKVQLLINRGIDVDCRYRTSPAVENSPLLSAIECNQRKMAELLLDNNADPSMIVGSDEGKSNGYPIYRCCINASNVPYISKLELLQLMIEKKPEIIDPVLKLLSGPYYMECYATERQEPEAAAIITEMKTLQREINNPIQRLNNEASSSTLKRRNVKGVDDTVETRAESDESVDSNTSDGKNPNSKIKANPHKTSSITPSAGVGGCTVM